MEAYDGAFVVENTEAARVKYKEVEDRRTMPYKELRCLLKDAPYYTGSKINCGS
jgi:hypothetical protein